MSRTIGVDIKLFEGPNVLAPFAAVVAEFRRPWPAPIAGARIAARLADFIPVTLRDRYGLGTVELPFEQLAATLARAVHEYHGALDLPIAVQTDSADICRILLGYLDAQAAMTAVRVGIELALAVFAADGVAEHDAALAAKVARAAAVVQLRQPDFVARALVRVARERGIPIYPVALGRIWLYGQGRTGSHMFEAASHHDSMTGARLSRDKFLSNQLVTRLGLPGVEHGIAHDEASALELAHTLGFPVVVKPIDGSQGQGVATRIGDAATLAAAFINANRISPGRVIVERQVAGDDCRLAVFGGQLAWAARRRVPQVTGDGQHSIAELIERDNQGRNPADIAAGLSVRLEVDADMRTMLARQGHAVDDRPEAGRVVYLRNGANIARGGIATDCTADVHPDNRALAEAVARGFHLDAVGIDFITPDISRSWREVACAIIEINCTPGFANVFRAQIIMERRFPGTSDGRIPSVVAIDAAPAVVDLTAAACKSRSLCVGRTDAAHTAVDDMLRCPATAGLPARVMALIHDLACAALVISARGADLLQHGFPLDRADLALVGPIPLPPALEALVAACARRVVTGVTPDNFTVTVAPGLDLVLRERGVDGSLRRD